MKDAPTFRADEEKEVWTRKQTKAFNAALREQGDDATQGRTNYNWAQVAEAVDGKTKEQCQVQPLPLNLIRIVPRLISSIIVLYSVPSATSGYC
jgi:hypothetical protein